MDLRVDGEPPSELAAKMLAVSADSVMFIVDSGHMAIISTTMPHILGNDLGYWEGRHFRDLLHPEDADAFGAMLAGDPHDPFVLRRDVLRVRARSADNEWLLVEARGFTRIEHDSTVGSVVSFRDAAGMVGLSGSRALAAKTIADELGNSRGLDNRHLAATEILPSVLRSCASAKYLCVLGVRMTNFDAVAKVHGRREADETITQTARAIDAIIRPTDLVVRVLDRRLVIACPNLEPRVVVDFGNRIRRVCQGIERKSRVTFEPSMGFALSSGGDDLRQVLDFSLEADQLDARRVDAR